MNSCSVMTHSFAYDLARYGPHADFAPPTLAQARTYCREFSRRQYENFSVVTALLPRPLVPHFHHVYAFCRWADNLGDETGGGARALELLGWWRDELGRMFDGSPRHPVMVALRETVHQFSIPIEPFLDLVSAFEQDQTVTRYSTFTQLRDYCRRSADPVGRIVLRLFNCFDEERAALSDSICTALQLTNFWQDVSRDLDIGRVYIPADDMSRFRYSELDLAARTYSPEFVALMQFEVRRAREWFQRGLPLMDCVPESVRVDVELFARGGLAVLGKIERLNYNVWRRRPTLAKWEKAALFARAMCHRWWNGARARPT